VLFFSSLVPAFNAVSLFAFGADISVGGEMAFRNAVINAHTAGLESYVIAT